jgi:uncharacterized protein (UPF0179 family)
MTLQSEKGKITVVGKAYAHEGCEFVYVGVNEACTSCAIYKVCHNLVLGRRYKVISTRDLMHECDVHEGNAQTVEVAPALISTRTVLPHNITSARNTSFVYQPPCNERCEYFFECHAPGLLKGQRYIIREIGYVAQEERANEEKEETVTDTITCPIGETRALVLLELLPDELPRFVSKQE